MVKRPTLAVAAAAFFTHVTALGAGFVWLDHAHIEAGAAIAKPAQWASLFQQGFAGTGYYRPLTALSLSIDALVSSGPFVFHFTNVVWHVLASMVVVGASEALGLEKRSATSAGILFAVHPISALVADAIAFRSEAMVVVALLGLLWAHVRRRPVLAALAIVGGALTKEVAIVLAPLFVLALELEQRKAAKRFTLDVAKKRLFGCELAALAVAVVLRQTFAPSWRATHEDLSASEAIGTRLAAFAKSVLAIAIPFDRSICDAFPITPLHKPPALAGLIALGALGWLAWKKRGPAVFVALAVLPSLQLVPVMRWWSPHYVYIALAFVAMLVADRVLATKHGTKALGGMAVALAFLTLAEGRRYATDALLWAPEVEHQAACREGQFYLGEEAREAKNWDEAARRYELALAPRPKILAYVDRTAALQNLGTVRLEQGRFRDAKGAFERALDGTHDDRTRREIRHNLAFAALKDGDPASAEKALEVETARVDAFPQSLLLRAVALEKLGRDEEARALRARLPQP
jgi:protein O-mannosyl-transferase